MAADELVDALARLARAADELGFAVVILDVPDCGNPVLVERRKALYRSYGFQPLPSNDLRHRADGAEAVVAGAGLKSREK